MFSTNPVVFEPNTRYSIGAAPASAIAIDANNDGKMDAVVVETGSNSVGVSFGNGHGGLSVPVLYPVGQAPVWVASADFNGDGIPDLATANSGDNTVSVLFGNGTGGFATAVNYSVGNSPQYIIVGKFNSDNHVDIATADNALNQANGPILSVLTNTGNGTFNTAWNSHVISQQDPNASSLAAADFNSDGKLDIAIGNPNTPNVEIDYGNGDGTFGNPTTINLTDTDPVRLAIRTAGSIAAADLNGDGNADLVVGQAAGGAPLVDVIDGNGDGTFGLDHYYSTGAESSPFVVNTADVNGDGKPDVLVANLDYIPFSGTLGAGGVSVLLNDGTGTLKTAVTYNTGGGPASVIAADFNNDGLPDLLTADSSGNDLGLALGSGAGKFAAGTDFSVIPPIVQEQGYPQGDPQFADFNGDGNPDLIVASTSNQNIVSVLLGNGDGTLQQAVTTDVGSDVRQVVVGKFDSDATPDAATVNAGGESVSVLTHFNAASGFQTRTDYSIPDYCVDLVAIDLNHDGFDDLVASAFTSANVYVLMNHGDGTFASPVAVPDAGGGALIATGDFNGDGFPDVVTRSWGGSSNLGVMLNLGITGGVWQGFSTTNVITNQTGSGYAGLAVADLNQDGKADLITTGESPNLSVTAYFGNGNGTFGTGTVVGSVPAAPNGSIAVGNLNGDGFPDLVIGQSGTADSVAVLLNKANNTSNGWLSMGSAGIVQAGTTVTGAGIMDLNHDGLPDIVTSNEFGQNVTVLLQGVNILGSTTANAGQTVILTAAGVGATAEGGSISYQWDLNYNGTAFNSTVTGTTALFTAGLAAANTTVAVRAIDAQGAMSAIATKTISNTSLFTLPVDGDADLPTTILPNQVGGQTVASWQITVNGVSGQTVSAGSSFSAPFAGHFGNLSIALAAKSPTNVTLDTFPDTIFVSGAPIDLSATEPAEGEVDLKWTYYAPLYEIVSGYLITATPVNGGPVVTDNLTGLDLYQARIQNLSPDVTYKFSVVAKVSYEFFPSEPYSAPAYITATAPAVTLIVNSQTSEKTLSSTLTVTGLAPATGSSPITTLLLYWSDNPDPTTYDSVSYSNGIAASLPHALSTGESSETVQIVAVNSNNIEFTLPPETIAVTPDGPTDLFASDFAPGEVDLSWMDDSSIETGFVVTATSGNAITTYSVPAGTFSDSITGLNPAATYNFTVHAANSTSNYAAFSEESSVATDSPVGTTVDVDSSTPGEIDLSWTPATDPASAGYQILSSADGTNFSLIGTALPGDQSFSIPGLGGGEHYFQVAAIDYDEPRYSSVVSINIETIPSAGSVTANSSSDSELDLSWTDPAGQANSFQILRADGTDGTYYVLATVDSGSSATMTYVDTAVVDGSAYSYKLISIGTFGTSVATAPVSAATFISNPSPFTADAVASDTILLSWADNSAISPEFEISRSNSSGGWVVVDTLPTGTTQFQDSGLSELTTYDYRIRAINDNSTSAYSFASAPTPITTPQTPLDFSATEDTADSIQLRWSPAESPITNYEIQYSASAGGPLTQLFVSATNTSCEISNLAPLTSYDFDVTSVYASGSATAESLPATITAIPSAYSFAVSGNSSISEGSPIVLTFTLTDPGNIVSSAMQSVAVDWSTGSSTASFVNGQATVTIAADPNSTPPTAIDVTTSDGNGNAFTLPEIPITFTPTVVSSVALFDAAPEQITVAWPTTSLVDTDVSIALSDDGQTFAAPQIVPYANGSYTFGSLVADHTYTFRFSSEFNGTSSSQTVLTATTTQDTMAITSDTQADENQNYSLELSDIVPSGLQRSAVGYQVNWGDGTAIALVQSNSQGPLTSTTHQFSAGSTAVRVEVTALDSVGHHFDLQPILIDIVPSAPTNFQITSTTASAVGFSWTNISTIADQVEIERSPSGANDWDQIAVVASDTDNFTDYTVGGINVYDYRVSSDRQMAPAAHSPTVTATTPAGDPLAPTNFTAEPISPGEIDLTWNNQGTLSVPGSITIGRYNSNNPNVLEFSISLPANATTYHDVGVQPNSTYSYVLVVVAHPPGQPTATSAVIRCGPVTTDPLTSSPGQFVLKAKQILVDGICGSIDVSWTYNSKQVQQFEVEEQGQGAGIPKENYHLVALRTGGLASEYTLSNVIAGSTYRFRVRADFADGTVSDYAGISVDAQSGEPDVTSKTSTSNTSGAVDLSWIWFHDAPNNFQIEFKPKNGAFWVYDNGDGRLTTPGTTTKLTISGLVPSLPYVFRVRAVASGHSSVWSYGAGEEATASGSYNILAEKISTKILSPTSVKVSWDDLGLYTDVNNNQSPYAYSLAYGAVNEYSGESGSGVINVELEDSNNTFTHTFTGLTPGVKVYFEVGVMGHTGDEQANTGVSVGIASTSATPGSAVNSTVPAAPQATFVKVSFSASPTTPASGNTVKLAWMNNPGNETGFEIQRRLTPPDGSDVSYGEFAWKAVATVNADVTTYTDNGMSPGNYQYRIRSQNGKKNSAWITAAAPVFPPGYLVAFDGTWDSRGNGFFNGGRGLTAISAFVDQYQPSVGRKDYHTGVGAGDHNWYFFGAINGAFAVEIGNFIASALISLSNFYKENASNVDQVPIDIVGYSRGSFEAVILANYIEKYGVPDPAFTKTVVRAGPLKGQADVVLHVPDPAHFLHPKIRFVGLISPVDQVGIDTPITVLSFGTLRPTFSVPTTLAPEVPNYVQLNDGSPGSALYPQTNISVGATTTSHFYLDALEDHPGIGMDPKAVTTLLNAGNAANAPVPIADAVIPSLINNWLLQNWPDTKLVGPGKDKDPGYFTPLPEVPPAGN